MTGVRIRVEAHGNGTSEFEGESHTADHPNVGVCWNQRCGYPGDGLAINKVRARFGQLHERGGSILPTAHGPWCTPTMMVGFFWKQEPTQRIRSKPVAQRNVFERGGGTSLVNCH